MQLQENHVGQEILESIPLIRGIMWEKIEEFGKTIVANVEECLSHIPGNKQSKEMQDNFQQTVKNDKRFEKSESSVEEKKSQKIKQTLDKGAFSRKN